MQIITDMFLIITQNLVFSALLGLPSAMQSAKDRRRMMRNGLLTMIFCAVNTGMIGVIRGAMPQTENAWMVPVAVAVTAIADLLAVTVLSLLRRPEIRGMILEVHLAAFSSAVLGLMVNSGAVSFVAGIRYGMRMGVGYLAASGMLAAVIPVVNSERMPEAVRGWRGLLMYTGVMALAVASFAMNAR